MAVNAKSAKAIIKQKIEEGTARSLSHNTQGLPGRDTSSIDINTIAEKLKSVNNENRKTFNQRACHVWTLTSLTLKRPLPVPGIWYTAGAFTLLRTNRRPGCIKTRRK